MTFTTSLSAALCAVSLGAACGLLPAQETGAPPAVEIAEDPKTVDPASLMPPRLAAPATVDFTNSSLNKITDWFQSELALRVLLDQKALTDAGVLATEPVSDRLDNAPAYLLLNRLRSLGLAWYVEDDILHITTAKVARERLSTQPYNVGDLFDAGYAADDLIAGIKAAVDGSWTRGAADGGSVELLGDVLFVRQTDELHREVAGLLAALRQHGRLTLTFDPPSHAVLREKLEQNVSVRFEETPLAAAIEQLAERAQADIRLDLPALRGSRVREREPLTLALEDRNLSTVLPVLLGSLRLTWILRDGVLWITTTEEAANFSKTAVFDVRDLCRDLNESQALRQAITSQTQGPWKSGIGGGSITFARPGTMVVRHTESNLQGVLQLLENYRTALRESKQRPRVVADPNEVLTRFYRLPAAVADDLVLQLPQLVQPASWQDEEHPNAVGTIRRLTSVAEVRSGAAGLAAPDRDAAPSRGLLIDHAALMVRQTRAAHFEIETLIEKVERGDPPLPRGGGSGGGGFGGGLFSGPASND